MSDDVIIKVENLSKVFKLYNNPKHRLLEAIHPFRKKYHHEYQALKDISFEIKRGEAVGILGKNGAGKSTLLKLLTGVLTPTSGRIEVKGKVAALLELGAGFNPMLTGRENILFQGAIMGFTQEEMIHKVPQIIEFADIGEFIDQPVKTYSSGMFARLAFSIAINVDPDILIIDEALSVGDAAFQAKCMMRMRKMMDSNLTLIFVSHDLNSVKILCSKCLVLESSKVKEFGNTVEVVGRYSGNMHLKINDELDKANYLQDQLTTDQVYAISPPGHNILVSTSSFRSWGSSVNRYGSGDGKIVDIKLLNESRVEVNELNVDDTYILQVSLKFERDFPTFCLGYSLRDLKGQQLVGGLSISQFEPPPVKVGELYIAEIKSVNKLRAGAYTISIGLEVPVLLGQQHIFLDVIENAIVVKSHFGPDSRSWFPALVNVPSKFSFSKVSDL